MDTVYIATSIVSYAMARRTSDVATAALQQEARRWMLEQRQNFAVVTSQLMVAVAAAGDADAAARRLAMLIDIPVLTENPEVVRISDELLRLSARRI